MTIDDLVQQIEEAERLIIVYRNADCGATIRVRSLPIQIAALHPMKWSSVLKIKSIVGAGL